MTRLHAAFLARTTTVVRNWGSIFDCLDVQACGLQRSDRAFSPATRAIDADIDIFHAEFDCFFSSLLSCHLTCEWSALATTFEATCAGTRPAERVHPSYR